MTVGGRVVKEELQNAVACATAVGVYLKNAVDRGSVAVVGMTVGRWLAKAVCVCRCHLMPLTAVELCVQDVLRNTVNRATTVGMTVCLRGSGTAGRTTVQGLVDKQVTLHTKHLITLGTLVDPFIVAS